MKTTPASLAKKIKTARTRLNLTQTQFAAKIGIKQQKLSEWENGKRLRGVIEGIALLKVIGDC